MTIQRLTNIALIVAITIAIIEAYMLYNASYISPEVYKELEQSKGRVEMLELQVLSLDSTYKDLEVKNSELDSLLEAKPKERILISRGYDKEISDVHSVSLDSTIRFISGRLSED